MVDLKHIVATYFMYILLSFPTQEDYLLTVKQCWASTAKEKFVVHGFVSQLSLLLVWPCNALP